MSCFTTGHVLSATAALLLLAAAAGGSVASPPVTNGYWRIRPVNPAWYESPYRISLFNPQHGEDGARAWSQTKSVFVYGIGVIAVLVSMPEEMTGWEKDPALLEKWVENVTAGPEWDRNNWIYNYVGHTYFGGVYYQVARKSGYRQWDAFIYSLLMSTFYWEYGIEAFAEVPSIQDLVVTPVAGWVYGEWAYQTELRIRNNENKVWGSPFLGNLALFLLDPIDRIGSGLNRLTGRRLIKSGYGYFSYNPIDRGQQIDHQVWLHLRIPVGGPAEPQLRKLTFTEQSEDPVDSGIIGLQLGMGYALFDKDWNVENAGYNNISLGLYFTPRISLRMAYARGKARDIKTGTELTYENYSLDTQLYLNRGSRLRPYLTGGFGEQMWEEDLKQKTFQWNGGIGLHCTLHRKWALQADWINYYSPSEKTYDQQINAGIIYRFGRGEHQDW